MITPRKIYHVEENYHSEIYLLENPWPKIIVQKLIITPPPPLHPTKWVVKKIVVK